MENYITGLENNDPTLVKLSINDYIYNSDMIHFAKALEKNTTLEKLAINRNSFCCESIIAFADMIKINNFLKKIDISSNHIGNNIGDNSIMTIYEALKINTSLQELNISYNNIDINGIIAISRVCFTLSLIKRNNLEALKVNTTLQELIIDNNSSGIIHIFEALKINKSLKKICFYEGDINDECAIVISDILKFNTQLEILNFSSEVNINKKELEKIIEFLKVNTTLKKLYMFQIDIDENIAFLLGKCLKINNTLPTRLKPGSGTPELALQVLDISFNEIGNGIIAIANFLKINNTLQILYINSCYIDEYGIIEICEALKVNTHLQKLYIGYNNIGENGAIAISRVCFSLSLIK